MQVGSVVKLKSDFQLHMKVKPKAGVLALMDLWQREDNLFEITKIRKGLFGDVTVALRFVGQDEELPYNFYMDMLEEFIRGENCDYKNSCIDNI